MAAAFASYLNAHPEFHTSGDITKIESSFIALRLRYDLATAAYGSISANQVLIENDAQAARAVEALPRAETLARQAAKYRGTNKK